MRVEAQKGFSSSLQRVRVEAQKGFSSSLQRVLLLLLLAQTSQTCPEIDQTCPEIDQTCPCAWRACCWHAGGASAQGTGRPCAAQALWNLPANSRANWRTWNTCFRVSSGCPAQAEHLNLNLNGVAGYFGRCFSPQEKAPVSALALRIAAILSFYATVRRYWLADAAATAC